MLLIETFLAPDAFGGVGLFSSHAIPQGTQIWRYEPAVDVFFTLPEYAALPPAVKQKIGIHVYPAVADSQFGVMYSRDHDRYTNHSDRPNTGPSWGQRAGETLAEPVFALRDIAAGEEITTDYMRFTPPQIARYFMGLPSFEFLRDVSSVAA